MKYLLDTNIVIHLDRYTPRDVHVGLWTSLEGLIASGDAFLQRECLVELERGTDELAKWAKAQSGFVLDASAAEVLRVQQISNAFAGWATLRKNWADPWVIACAEANDLAIVTDERLRGANVAPENTTIPTVLAALGSGARCMKSLDMQRQENWKFT